MLIEIQIIAEDSREALPDLARLARRFGLDVESVEIDRDPQKRHHRHGGPAIGLRRSAAAGAAGHDGNYDRAAVLRDAHKRFRDGKRLGLGWTFGPCLSTAWQAAKMRREAARLPLAA